MIIMTSIAKIVKSKVTFKNLIPIPQLSATDVESTLLELSPKKLPPLPKERDLLRVYGIKAKKQLSQNFLLDPRLIFRLVRAAGVMPGYRVVEVGPGPGNLTRSILQKGPLEVLAIEKDRRFLPLLEMLADSVEPGQLKIVVGDAMDHTFTNAFGQAENMDFNEANSGYKAGICNVKRRWEGFDLPPIRIIGNLPFSVSTALLIKWLDLISMKKGFWEYGRVPMLLTFQEEVARRITADPCSSERTRLSAMVQNYCRVKYMFTIKGTSFTPPAIVNTGVVKLEPRIRPYCDVPFRLFEKFVRHLYHHRNKDVLFNVRTLFPKDMTECAENVVQKAEVSSFIRCYMVSNIEISRMCSEYYEYCKQYPALTEFNYRAGKKLVDELSLKVLREAGLCLLEENIPR